MIEKILKLFKIHLAQDLKLMDGTNIRLDGNLDIGVNAYVTTTDGEIPLPDGDYTLESGEIITAKNGQITDVVNKPVDETATPASDTKTNLSVETPEYKTDADPEAVIEEEVELAIDPNVSESVPSASGTTEVQAPEVPVDGVDMPMNPEMDAMKSVIEEMMNKIAELEVKIEEISNNTNLMKEKFSAAKPVVKKSDSSEPEFKKDDRIEAIKKLRNGK